MRRRVLYVGTIVVVALVTVGVMALGRNIVERRSEAERAVFELVELDETVVDPELWGRNFPRQYEGYLATADTVRTRFGGVEAILKGFRIVNPMPYEEANRLVDHPVSCIDCHDPRSMDLRVTRPGFLLGIRELAASRYPTPFFPSIEEWRAGDRSTPYDPNALASRQEMRTLVCAQCHVEYYFQGEEKQLVYPWDRGLRADQILAYDERSARPTGSTGSAARRR